MPTYNIFDQFLYFFLLNSLSYLLNNGAQHFLLFVFFLLNILYAKIYTTKTINKSKWFKNSIVRKRKKLNARELCDEGMDVVHGKKVS